MKRKITKKTAQKLHLRSRARTRFGLELTPEDHEALVETVAHGRRTFLGRQSNRVSVFLVEFGGREMKVIYDRSRGTVVTALPPDADVWVLEGDDDGKAHSVVEIPAHADEARGPVPDDPTRGTGA